MLRPLFTARKLTNIAVIGLYAVSRHQEWRFKANLRWKLPLSANLAANRRFNEVTASGSVGLIGCAANWCRRICAGNRLEHYSNG
jgi:hypothetical protein